jgi:GTP-binding protein Era
MTHKSAFISIVGRPNTGKSTLLNALVGEKIAITSHHPNTTRRAIRGIVNLEDCQLVFVDTPGLHKPKTALGGALNAVVSESLDDVDVIIQCIPINSPVGTGDEHVAREISRQSGAKKFAVVTMMDRADNNRAPQQLLAVSELARKAGFQWDEIVPLSSLRSDGISLLIDLLAKYAPQGPKFFPDEMKTDQELENVLADLIRESTIRELNDELPHSVAVTIDDLTTRPSGELVDIHASIVVERDSQKAIIIGKKGARLKEIGTSARREIEAKVGKKVYLALQVKVMSNWQSDSKALGKLGFTPR